MSTEIAPSVEAVFSDSPSVGAGIIVTFKVASAPLPSPESHLTLAVDNFIIYT
jgi:hypothetical protein